MKSSGLFQALCFGCLSVLSPTLHATPTPSLLQLPYWDQGKAEINLYEATEIRYGIARKSEVTHVLVKEGWDQKKNVKAAGKSDFSVIKLNQILSIPTGVYTYRQMVSSFFSCTTGKQLKFTMSNQEACGATFKSARIGKDNMTLNILSYFDGEGDQTSEIKLPPGPWLFYDDVPLVLRMSASTPLVQPLRLDVFPSTLSPRTGKLNFAPGNLTETRRTTKEISYELSHTGGKDTIIFEASTPHRMISWERADGSKLHLKKSVLSDYWNQNRVEDADALDRLPDQRKK